MTQTSAVPAALDIKQITEILPHRFPFLLVDRILEMGDGHIVGQKCVTANEWFFQGHFPGDPIMPGVLQLEAMAQTGAVLVRSRHDAKDKLVVIVGVTDAKFRRIVRPGDVLRIELTETYRRPKMGKTEGRILVDGQVVCEALLTFALYDK